MLYATTRNMNNGPSTHANSTTTTTNGTTKTPAAAAASNTITTTANTTNLMPGDEGFEYGDPINLTCLLCLRQFKSFNQLQRHNNESKLHESNLGDAALREIAKEKIAAARRGHTAAAARKKAGSLLGATPATAASASTNLQSTSSIEANKSLNLSNDHSRNRLFPTPTSSLSRRRYSREFASTLSKFPAPPSSPSGMNTATASTAVGTSTTPTQHLQELPLTPRPETDTIVPKSKKKKRKKKKPRNMNQVAPSADGEDEEEEDDDKTTVPNAIEDEFDDEQIRAASMLMSSNTTSVDVLPILRAKSPGETDPKEWVGGLLTDEPQSIDDPLRSPGTEMGSVENKKRKPRKKNRTAAAPAASGACVVRDDHDETTLNDIMNMNVTGNKRAVVADISGLVRLAERDAVGTGGCCDLFVGTHVNLGRVALKRPRFTHAEENVLRRFRKEAEMWCTFHHKRILPFLGMAQIGRHLYLVSPWVGRGNLSELLIREPSLDHMLLLCEIAEALVYLHSLDVVHGDIKSQNVLVTDDGHALLCDFGLTKVLDKMMTSTEVKGGGSTRYMAPELLTDQPKTLASDVYAFAMTMVEVVSRKPPFSHIESNYAVMLEIAFKDGRPLREPTHSKQGTSYKDLWDLIEKCWATVLKARPKIGAVLDELRFLYPQP